MATRVSSAPFQKILVIQTAFLGDVILATALLETLHFYYPNALLDIVVKKGYEGLFASHPFIRNVYVLDKSKNKWKNLFTLGSVLRKESYDWTINVQRFFSSGLLTVLSNAKITSGFSKNPCSILFTYKHIHVIKNLVDYKQEIYRNHVLIEKMTGSSPLLPRLYPSTADFEAVSVYRSNDYITIAPASVWETKKTPIHVWVNLISKIPENINVYLLGAPSDEGLCNEIKEKANRANVVSLCGKLSFLQSAALIQGGKMNYANDSAPLHLASAMNAPSCAVFCSTVPNFGFGPLSSNSTVVQAKTHLPCKPCGVHGRKSCPEGHFNCGNQIDPVDLYLALAQSIKPV